MSAGPWKHPPRRRRSMMDELNRDLRQLAFVVALIAAAGIGLAIF